MSEAGFDNLGDPSQTVLDESVFSSVQNGSQLEPSDVSSVLSTEASHSAGADLEVCGSASKISSIYLMEDAMAKFKEEVESELNKTLDEHCPVKDFQESSEKLKAIVKYLLEQNELLLSSLAEVGSEAEKRTDLMQRRLRESAATTRDTVYKISDWGEELQDLVAQKCLTEEALYDTQCLVEKLQADNRHLKSHNANLCHDIQSLLSIISEARSTGNWEMDCVTFCEISPEDVYGSICRMSSTQHTDTPRSVTMNDATPDSYASTSETEGTSIMNGIGTENETGFSCSTPANKVKAPTQFQRHTWPSRSHPVLYDGTNEDSSPFWLSHYLTPDDTEASPALAPRTSSYMRTPSSLESLLSPSALSKKNEWRWTRRCLFPSSLKMDRAMPNQRQPLDASTARADEDARSPSAQTSSLKGTAASDRAQRDQQQPLDASRTHTGEDARSTSAETISLKGTAASDRAQTDQQQPLDASSALTDEDTWSPSVEASSLKGTAASGRAQTDQQQPLDALSVHTDEDARSPLVETSSLEGTAASNRAQTDQQQPLDASRMHTGEDARSTSVETSSLKGMADSDEAQTDQQQPLDALRARTDKDARSPSVETSSLKGTAASDIAQPGHTTYSGTVHRSPSIIDVSTQTEVTRKTFGVTSTQTDADLEQSLPSGNGERDQELCSLRERLNLASQEAQSKTLLAMQLQTHLDSSSKQVELMEHALQNLEKKLTVSRQECDNLKKEITSVQGKWQLADAATKKEQGRSAQLKTELQQLSVTVQHLQDALVELKKSAVKEDSPSISGPRVHNV